MISVYELPFGHGHAFGARVNRPTELLIGGWQLNYIETMQSGAPNGLNGAAYPIQDPNTLVQKSFNTWFNPCVRQLNGTSLQPNPAPNGFVSCSNPAWQLINSANLDLRATPFQSGYIRDPNPPLADLSFSKRFNITDRYNAQFRFEIFNVTYTAVRGAANTNPTSNQFELIQRKSIQHASAGTTRVQVKFLGSCVLAQPRRTTCPILFLMLKNTNSSTVTPRSGERVGAAGINRRDFVKAITSGVLLTAGTLEATPSSPADRQQQANWSPVAPGVWKATLGTPEAQTPVRARQIGPALEPMRRLAEVKTPPLPSPSGSVGPRGVGLQLPLEANELMYGFGLQLLSFQQRNKKRIIRVNADPKVDSGDSHAPVPFYVTTRGYGVLVDTFRHATFYCGEAHPRPEQAVPPEMIEVNTPQNMRAHDRGQASRVLVEIPRCAGVDVYLFAGPELRTAVQRYNLFSGGGVLPPEWGLGFWYRPEMHLDAQQVLALGREFRANKIPCDVLGLEPGWQTHTYSCTFAWDKHRFPDPGQFIRNAGDLGFRVNLWEHAFTHPASPIFSDLLPHSGDIGVWDGLVPDFAGDPARRIFGNYHGRALIDLGISGFKLDECDNSDFTEGWSFPDSSRFPSGVDGEQMHGQFGLRYQDAILQQFTQRGKPTYNLVRSSGALAAPYPFVLYSDLYDHRQFIRALVNAGFSGLLWCPEVRDATSEEDLIRRLQSVVFSPLAMVNAWYIRNPPWKQIEREQNNGGRFSPGWEGLQARCREIISWRMQLLPYLRAAFAVYQRDGLPPFRALLMDHPDDLSLTEVDDQYLIGDRMVVAPLFAGEPQRNVVLPRGDWHDFWTGAPVAGGRQFTIPATTEKIPVYVKAGSVVPWAEVAQHAAAPEARRLTVRVYGDGSLGWSAPESVGGLRLLWDGVTKRGSVQQNAGDRPAFQVTEWRHMG